MNRYVQIVQTDAQIIDRDRQIDGQIYRFICKERQTWIDRQRERERERQYEREGKVEKERKEERLT